MRLNTDDAAFIARLARVLITQYDLDLLDPSVCAARSCALAVFRPSEPSERLNIDAVIDIVMLSHFTGKLDLKYFKSLAGLALTADRTVGYPISPVAALNERSVSYPSEILRRTQCNGYCLETL